MFRLTKSKFALCYIFYYTHETVYILGQCQNRQDLNKIEFIDEKGLVHYIDLTAPVDIEPEFLLTRRNLADNVQFWLYSSENKNSYEELFLNEEDVVTTEKTASYFKSDRPVVMVTHGWLSSGGGNATQLIKNAFLAQNDVNLIIVNWEKEAGRFNYVLSAASTALVAERVTKMILLLATRYDIKGEDVHLIGHSLGAHIMGLAGKILKEKDNLTIGRITGLDPARPFFEFPNNLAGITSDAAAFVDIIHTNSGVLGYIDSIGHVDFYPNGGLWQPHCCKQKKCTCSHSCAYVYFAESILNVQYIAFKCDSYLSYLRGLCDDSKTKLMGYTAEPTAFGSYYLNIGSEPSLETKS